LFAVFFVLLVVILLVFFNYGFKISGKVIENLDLNNYNCDLNQDGAIGLDDFKILNLNHDEIGCKGPDWCSGSDIDWSGFVDIKDFEILSEVYVNQQVSAEIEEPSKEVFCEEWSKCKVVYGLNELIEGDVFLEGEMIRMCGDSIEREKCDSKIPITTKKVFKCSKEYVEVYDVDENLISRLELVEGDYKMLNINLDSDTASCF